jgi:hypothetical protein
LFGGQAERQHDFGLVIGSAELKLSHSFNLTNTTGRSVRLLRAVNHKPCCGDVRFQPTTLSPGQEAKLEVTIRIGESTEPFSHLTVLETDHPSFPRREFYVFARPHPHFRLDPDDNNKALAVTPKSSIVASFIAFAYGTQSQPPISLGEATVASDSKATWCGPSRDRVMENGLIERSRPISLSLRGDGDPGDRISTINVTHGSETLGASNFRWEVVPGIKASPSTLLLTHGSDSRRRIIWLRSQDGRPFQVVDVSSSVPGIRGTITEKGAKLVHNLGVTIGLEPGNSTRWGQLTIKTSHPSQPIVKMTVFIAGHS